MYVFEELYSYEKMLKTDLELYELSTDFVQKGWLFRMLSETSMIPSEITEDRYLDIWFDLQRKRQETRLYTTSISK